MSSIRRLLVVVDADVFPSPAVLRALELARRSGARVDLFEPLFDLRIAGLAEAVDGEVEALAREQLLTQHRQRLEQWVGEQQRLGLSLGVEVAWVPELYEAVNERCAAGGGDLVVKDLRFQSFLRAWSVVHPDDLKLARRCRVPLWLVQAGSRHLPRAVMAAVDPIHPLSRPSGLDDQVLAQALQLARASEARLQLIHVFPFRPARLGSAARVNALVEQQRLEDAERFNAFADHHSVPPEQRVLLTGEPAEMILTAVASQGIELLVLGAEYRDGLDRFLLGSQAEALVRHAGCDLLLIHPAG